MTKEHYIESIELFANDKSLGKVTLDPKSNTEASAEFQVPLAKGMKLKAVEYCNIHGKWESERGI